MNAAPITVAELCRQLGTEAPPALAGFAIHGIAPLDAAGPTEASFVVRAKAAKDAATTKAGVVFVPKGSEGLHAAAVPVPEVWAAVLALLKHFHPEPAPVAEIHDSAVVDKHAEIGAQVSIGPGATIAAGAVLRDRCRIGAQCHVGAGAYIGEDSVLHPRVTVLDRCRIGQRVILHSGVVVGSDGYKYEVVGKRLQKIPQVGIVVVEDDVEIGANTTIDRASFAATKIGARTKIDNLVQIGHNVEIGSDCLIVAQVGIAGSAKIGRGVILAGQAGVRDNVTIGDGSRVGGQSGIQGDLPPRSDVMGSPAIPAKDFARVLYVTRKLPELYRALKGAGFSSSTEE